MSINTKIKGKPESITAAAQWLTGTLAPSVRQAATAAAGARSDAFTGAAAESFAGWARRASQQADAVADSIGTVADAMQTFATALRGAQRRMAEIRSDASGAGLDVAGFVIQDPGAGPGAPGSLPSPGPGASLPPGTEQAHARAVADYLAWVKKVKAYLKAKAEAKTVFASLARSAAALDAANAAQAQTPAWKDGIDFATGVVGEFAGKYAKGLTDSAARIEMSAIDGFLNEEQKLARGLSQQDFVDSAKERIAPRTMARVGAEARETRIKWGGLGATAALSGLGVVIDLKNGESVPQAVLSNGAGAGAGILAGMGTGMALGTAIPVPVVGTVVGAVVGAAAGAFASGAVDSLFKDNNVLDATWDGVKNVGNTAVTLGKGAVDIGEGAVKVVGDAPGAVVDFFGG